MGQRECEVRFCGRAAAPESPYCRKHGGNPMACGICGAIGCQGHLVPPDTSGIPRSIDLVGTSPTVSVPDLTTPELAAIQIALQDSEGPAELLTDCASCGWPMDQHPVHTLPVGEFICEYYIDPDFNAYQDSDDE